MFDSVLLLRRARIHSQIISILGWTIYPTFNLTLAKYANDTIGDLTGDFKVIEVDKHATISGSQAYRIVNSGIEENVNLQAMLNLTIKYGDACVITYTAQPEKYL